MKTLKTKTNKDTCMYCSTPTKSKTQICNQCAESINTVDSELMFYEVDNTEIEVEIGIIEDNFINGA